MKTARRTVKAAFAALLFVAIVEISAPTPVAAQVYLRRNADGILEATDSPESSEFRLRFSAKGVVIHSRGFRSRARPEFDPIIDEAAERFGVPSDFVRAIIKVESAFDEYAVSSKGAKGLMQLMPATARRFGVSDPFDPRQSIMGGTEYLAYLLGLFRGNFDLAAAGYNAGENAVLRYGGVPPYRETRNYVVRVNAALGATSVMTASAGGRMVAEDNSNTIGFAGSLPSNLMPAPRRTAEAPPRPQGRTLGNVPARLYYRWTDEGGGTHFSDSPPPEGTAFQTIRGLP